MPDEAFDVAVIGGGSAGYVGAIRGAQLGLKVAVIEKEKVGGTCLHRGCIPTKSFLHSSELAHEIQGAAQLGIKTNGVQIDWPAVLKRKDSVVNQLWRGTEFLLKKNKVTVFQGEGVIESEHKVVVKNSGQAINAKNLVVATGSRPKSLPGLNMDGDRVINSDHAVSLDQMPKSIVIVVAGAVGTEFACVYNGYAAKVPLAEFLPTLLPLEDSDVGQQVAKVLGKRGFTVLTGAQLQPDTLKRANGKLTVAVKTGEQSQTIDGERLLVAVGREGITDGFGLEKLDIQVEKGYIKTDEHYRTGHPNVYAAGDVIGNFLLAHVAYYEGEHIMEYIAGKNPKPLDYNRVPRATYTYPQVASLGLSEKQAKDQGLKVKVGKFPLVGNAKSVILGETEGFVKIISDEESGDLLGVFIIGPNATELISETALEAARVDPVGDWGQHPSAPDGLGIRQGSRAGRRRARHPHLTMATKTQEVEAKGGQSRHRSLGLSDDQALRIYEVMRLARAVDERMWLINRQGRAPFVISCQGQEGAQVGTAAALRPGSDWVAPYYRDAGVILWFGMTARDQMLSFFARREDPNSAGRQMPGHFGSRRLHILTGGSPVATQLLHAAGLALASKQRKEDAVTAAYFGDGSASPGA